MNNNDNIPLHEAITPNFESFDAFLEAFKDTPLIKGSPAEFTETVFPLVRQFIVACRRTFPEGIPAEDESRRKLEAVFETCNPMVKQLALRSFLPNLAFYTDAYQGRRALTEAFCGIMTAIIKHFPPAVGNKSAPIKAFIHDAHGIASKLGEELGIEPMTPEDDDCTCPACELRRTLAAQFRKQKDKVAEVASPKIEVIEVDPDDPELPPEVKEMVESIKATGKTPHLNQHTAMINFIQPEQWDAALNQFPPPARPEILKMLRKQYHKATGMYAPGDPNVRNQ